jgi:hypothetical protein
VSAYKVSDVSAVVDPLAEKSSADVGFYWTNAGSETVKVTVNGRPATATFAVNSPNWSLSATTCHVGIDDNGRPDFVPRTHLATPAFGPGLNNFPTPPCGDQPGISWTARSPGSSGQVALTQLISTKEWHNNVPCLLPGARNGFGADQHDFYRNRILTLPQAWMGNDSPATTLAYALLGGTYRQSFNAQDYLMYKPMALPGSESIWVALGVLNWDWQATVAKDKKGQWTITNSQLNPGKHIIGTAWDNPPPNLGLGGLVLQLRLSPLRTGRGSSPCLGR